MIGLIIIEPQNMRKPMIVNILWMMELKNGMMILLYQHIGMPCRHCFVDISSYKANQLNICMRDGEILSFILSLMILNFSSVM